MFESTHFLRPAVLSVFTRKGKMVKIRSSLEVYTDEPRSHEACGILLEVLIDDSVVDSIYFKLDVDATGEQPEAVDLAETQMLLGLDKGSLTP